MMRLDAIPITGPAHMSKSEVPESYAVRVNCVLHSGQLSEQQELDVRVNGVPQTGVSEGDQHVFTWQFFRASDEVRIALLSRGIRMKYWQACWNERDAILHVGTLPVHVFFNGQPHLLLEATMPLFSSVTLTDASSLFIETDGYAAIRVLERDQNDYRMGGGGGAPSGDLRTVLVPDLLVIATSGHALDVRQEKEAASQEVRQEGRERDAHESEEEENEDQWEVRAVVEMVSNEALPVDGAVREDDSGSALYAEVHDFVSGDTQQHLARSSPSMGRCIATFHIRSLASQEVLQLLNDLVAMMPPKTLIVDVRPKDRQRKRYQDHDGLSKPFLRSVFGAKYWDRGWAIQITSHIVPPTDSGGLSTWRYVVNKPDSHPDGILSLAKKLEEGYSIVVMDSIATYGESRRRAVIEELQQRVSGLDVGPLG